jgi:WD40 repeat protein
VFFADTLKFFLSLYGHKLPVLSLDISSDGALLASGSADKNLKIWGMDFGDCHRSLFAHQDSVMQVSHLSPKMLVAFTQVDILRILLSFPLVCPQISDTADEKVQSTSADLIPFSRVSLAIRDSLAHTELDLGLSDASGRAMRRCVPNCAFLCFLSVLSCHR